MVAWCPCRYKHEIRKEDKEALRKLIKVQYHYQVSPEITRELDASRYTLSSAGSVQLALCFAAQSRSILVICWQSIVMHTSTAWWHNGELTPSCWILGLHAAVLECEQVHKSHDAASDHILSYFDTFVPALHILSVRYCMHVCNRWSGSYCWGQGKLCHAACDCFAQSFRILFCFRSRGEKESGVAAMEVQSRVGKNVVEDPRDLPPVIFMDEDWFMLFVMAQIGACAAY